MGQGRPLLHRWLTTPRHTKELKQQQQGRLPFPETACPSNALCRFPVEMWQQTTKGLEKDMSGAKTVSSHH